jgi:3-oxoadipate enol-lactonase
MTTNAGSSPSAPEMLTHRIDGDGPPLVLLNGGFMSIAAWESFVAPLSAHYRVIRCDFRGQLLSPGPYPGSLDEHALDVLSLLDSLGITSAHIAGASFGAEVALTLAALAPERVDRLTVISATDRLTERMRSDIREGKRLAEEAAAGRPGSGEELFRRVLTDTWSETWLARQPPNFIESRAQQASLLPSTYFAGAAALLGALDSLDLTDALARIAAPALVIGGEDDRVFPPEHSQAIANGIANARLEIIPDTGHGLLIEHANRVIELLCA